VICDTEAVEAVSERLARLAPAGTSAEALDQPRDAQTSEQGVLASAHAAGTTITTGPVRVRAWVDNTPEVRATVAIVRDELARFAALAAGGLGLRGIGELTVTEVPHADWRTAWRSEFPVLKVGRIVVRPPWLTYAPAANEVVVVVEPGQAFGTGLHPTTRLALAGLERWAAAGHFAALPPETAGLLDVGTGSGILLIAALQLGAARGCGIDIDEHAVRAATENLERNALTARAEIRLGSLPHPAGALPLVVANLIADVQIALAPLLSAAVAPGGRLLASGIFVARADATIGAMVAAGLTMVERWDDGDWCAMEFVRQ
jgi:ribosomal protein L11 methyltransferase